MYDFLARNSLEVASWALALTTGVLAFVTYFQLREARKMRKHVFDMEEQRERDRQRDRKKALLVATCLQPEYAHQWQLALHNNGQGVAREISIYLDGEPAEKNWGATSVAPLDVLGPGADFIYWMRKAQMNESYPTRLEVTWLDDSGEPGRFMTTVSLTHR